MIFTNDADLYYEDSREGSKTIVMLHGNGENLNIFSGQRDFFLKLDYRVIVMDTRYHGKSGRGTKPLNFTTFAEDVRDLLNFLNIQKADILGFSDGANIALHLCMIVPEKVDNVVLVSPNIFPKGLKGLAFFKAKRLWERFLGVFNKRIRKQAELTGLMTNEPKLKFSDINKIENRALIISGTRDVIKKKHIKNINEAIVNSESLVLDGGHFLLFEDEAADVNLEIFKFLENYEFSNKY